MKNSITFVTAKRGVCLVEHLVPWMSGLVSGLQNHVRRFESARYLRSTAVAVLFLFIYSMADNYLEKKMEQHKARVVSQAAAKRSNLYSLLEHSLCRGAFDAYTVREDQLVRIVGAAARTATSIPFRFRFVMGDEAAALRSCNNEMVKATAYIAICSCGSFSADYMMLGRVVQAMLLQAAEIGLCGAIAAADAIAVAGEALNTPQAPLALLAFGRSAEPLLPFETAVPDSDIKELII